MILATGFNVMDVYCRKHGVRGGSPCTYTADSTVIIIIIVVIMQSVPLRTVRYASCYFTIV